jgi:hypothetical protein
MSVLLSSRLPVRRHVGLFALTGVASLGFAYLAHALAIPANAEIIYLLAAVALLLALVANPVRTLYDAAGTKIVGVLPWFSEPRADRGQSEAGSTATHTQQTRAVARKPEKPQGGWVLVASLALSMFGVSVAVRDFGHPTTGGEASAPSRATAVEAKVRAATEVASHPMNSAGIGNKIAFEPAAAAAAAMATNDTAAMAAAASAVREARIQRTKVEVVEVVGTQNKQTPSP